MNLKHEYKQFEYVARFERAMRKSPWIKRLILEEQHYMRSNKCQWMLFPLFQSR